MAPFDPYHKWLAIPPEEQPANHYRLLALPLFESDADVIDAAAEQRTVFLRSFQTGPNAELAERLLNEVSEARVCLLDGKSKARYDMQLRAKLEPVPEDGPPGFTVEELAPVASRASTRQRSREGKPFWQQPWAIPAAAGGIVVVLILLMLLSSGGDKSLPAGKQQGPATAKVDRKPKVEVPNEKTEEEQQAELERLVDERVKQELAQAEQERLTTEKAEQERLAAEKVAAEEATAKAAAEKAAVEKLAAAKAAAKAAMKKAAAEKLAAEKAAAKVAAEKAAILARNPITNTIGMKLNKIPAGTFLMGSPEGERGRQDGEHQHKVTISKPFYMQTTEVTQGQWQAVMGTEPWKGKILVKEGPSYAAGYVSWDDAVAFCKKLSEREGKTYRLPTEAQWEYACRAGTETAWSFGDDEKELGDYAWYRENAWDIDEEYAHQVGQKKPNAFGLYDMHGNVYEWCHDYSKMDYYKQSPAKDPTGPTSGSFRVLRGGSWNHNTRSSRSARRYRLDAGNGNNNHFGFRLVRELDDSTQSTPPPVPPTAPAIESITNTIGMSFNLIPAGTFMMGSPESEEARQDDEHQHQVTISKAFYMQTTDVTQGQWKAMMGTEPWKGQSYVKEGANYPASYVSWNEAVAYCKKLSEREGKTYRLPTEAEWEYACRGGTKTTWSFGNDEKALGDYAWYEKNADNAGEQYAHQVGLKKPNTFGLYDMHGNVYEWCHDYYGEDYYKQSPEKDPTGTASGSFRVLRGGSWFNVTRHTRSATRNWNVAGLRRNLFGFRLVRELD